MNTIDQKIRIRPAFTRSLIGMMIIGLSGIIAGFVSDPARIWMNILLGNYYFLSLAIGGLFFLALQYITQSGWSSGFRRIPESMGGYLPVAAVIALILLAGMASVYSWVRPEEAGFDEHQLELLEHKSGYLNVPFFIIRLVFYFVIWIWMFRLIRKASVREDREGGMIHFNKLEKYSKIFIFLLALTFSLATFDWIMSVQPTWYSAIFALKNFVAAFYHGTAIVLLVLLVLHHYGHFPFIREAHWQDFSRYIFILGIIWGYFWFAQYLLIWYANIPEETFYYAMRLEGGWKTVFYLNFVLNTALPFVLLLSNYFARKKTVLGIVIVFLIIGQFVDLFEQLMPGTVGGPKFGFVELATFIGFAGLFLYIFVKMLGGQNLIPANHPYLNECTEHGEH